MPDAIRWGVLGTGDMASRFARGLKLLPDAELTAVGSRGLERARTFAHNFGIPKAYGSYEELAQARGIDVIFVATPNHRHHRDALLCLDAGKAVLCEKPFALSAGLAERVVQRARERGLFVMEALWTRFFPLIDRLRELLAAGAIGEVQMVRADLSHVMPVDPQSRLWNPQLGGGALLDVGVYTISLASMILGGPQGVYPSVSTGVVHVGPTGVDNQGGCVLRYPSGAIAVLSFSQTTRPPREAIVAGTDGYLRILGRWHQPRHMQLVRDGREEAIERNYAGEGYHYEAAAVMNCLRQGHTECPQMPLDETLAILKIMDGLRASWDLHYPGETSDEG